MGARLALFLAAALSSAHLGCTTACDTNPDSNPPQVYTAGLGDSLAGSYESSPSTSGLLPFPGGKQYFLVHHLGYTPSVLTIDVGFNANGDDLAPCAGNTCVHPCVNSELIWIRNDTCADFLVRVVASGHSNFQDGTLCPGGASISVGTTDASVTPPATPDSSAEATPSPEAGDAPEASPAE